MGWNENFLAHAFVHAVASCDGSDEVVAALSPASLCVGGGRLAGAGHGVGTLRPGLRRKGLLLPGGGHRPRACRESVAVVRCVPGRRGGQACRGPARPVRGGAHGGGSDDGGGGRRRRLRVC
jgi:hypothetical protein